jgi:ribonuclease PH
MNVVMNNAGHYVELQGTAEGHAFRPDELAAMLALAGKGIRELLVAQERCLAEG